MRSLKLSFVFSILFVSICSGQNNFAYKRKIQNNFVGEDWRSVTLPPDIFKHLRQDFSDIRIYAFSGKDTVEVPYVIDVLESKVIQQHVTLPVLNESRSKGVYYLTFENKEFKLNHLNINFKEDNYFASVKIAGSNDNKQWVELADNKKVFAVHNENQSYSSSIVNFPVTDFRFIKLAISCDEEINFSQASFWHEQIVKGTFDTIPKTFTLRNDKKIKTTTIEISLKDFQPVSNITIDIKNTNDYYRQLNIEALVDSTKTEKGWIYNYQSISQRIVSSFGTNEFAVPMTLTSRLRLVVVNNDDAPLSINDISLTGARVQLRARFGSNETYVFYGNNEIHKPSYDVEHFRQKVNAENEYAALGPEIKIAADVRTVSAIFENKAWLWGILLATVGLLGFFTLRMMKAKA